MTNGGLGVTQLQLQMKMRVARCEQRWVGGVNVNEGVYQGV